MSEARGWQELAIAMARMARDLLAQDSVQHTLDRIVVHAADLVEGCEAAGILVLRGGRVVTMTATDNVVRASDRMQADLREGPCFDAAYNKEEVYRIADMTTTEQRWPRFAPKARELGVGSMMGFLLFTDGKNDLGALNLYSPQPGAFTERSEQTGWILASHAAVALASAHTNAQLHEAIGTRQDIGEALGIIMERHKLTEDEAFDLLMRISQDRNIKIRKLANTITTTGDLPRR
ncbi:GAF and ANTAR domain-containing protein [Qaidamihabitans albus]|uniref:GAF and ANTAR domain-containing protein n=1 Tax=Qaidamihabitans albus TaxID=2795733 RepID=UPI0027DE7A08|nr:GAF and ANTAR domain-containing protein [Qaidamihabitans albus]